MFKWIEIKAGRYIKEGDQILLNAGSGERRRWMTIPKGHQLIGCRVNKEGDKIPKFMEFLRPDSGSFYGNRYYRDPKNWCPCQEGFFRHKVIVK
jgi:hypothetical protein